MIVLKGLKIEVAKCFPETPSIIHEMNGTLHNIGIKDDALTSVEYKNDMLFITFDLDYCIAYNFNQCWAISKYDYMHVELY